MKNYQSTEDTTSLLDSHQNERTDTPAAGSATYTEGGQVSLGGGVSGGGVSGGGANPDGERDIVVSIDEGKSEDERSLS